ncbi:hypothetical protein C0Q70_15398 [Pomacea canaliculata]|uniref:alpha-mannosidase n=1 Tax=Pomacea canaliculata TaxID=400727 RepID=A0A2T7NUS3_POMCA|nr:hypothetical protein C0Q70_15398 [Pomacea canaliculata]
MEPHITFKHRRTTLERAEKFISLHHFADINLQSRLYPERIPVTSVSHFAAPGRITYAEAIQGKFKPVKVEIPLAHRKWATHWFCLNITVPDNWVHKEVRLIWDSRSEAMVWIDGQPKQGLSAEKDRFDYILSYKHEKNSLSYQVYIEMACNGLFGVGKNGMIAPSDPSKNFTLQRELPEAERGFQALYAANDFVNTCDPKNRETYHRASDIAKKFFKQRNGESQHTIYAMGHSHIDTAWLWPYAETIRKCARSWSCTLRLMEQYPNFTFTCSQAQQYAWVKEYYPSIYQDICKFVNAGQFVPVGGTWVEMDGYVPSGEAFVRQFLYGQRFFQQEFGIKCTEFWLPDTFGYSGQLPQIMRQCGITRFLTQKLSWNLINKFPHHTFWWEGIDGSKVLSHFPPGDSYHMEGQVKEILYTVNNFRDKGRSSRSIFLFGYGDGGNGPDEHMLGRLKRMEDIDGLPKVKMSTPNEFFSAVEQEDRARLCTWRGELYLELHNGTYTTHAQVKRRNRCCEFLLQELEQLWTVAVAFRGSTTAESQELEGNCTYPDCIYPGKAMERLWKLVLLNQFHDVLPGSSITIVYDDAHQYYKEIENEGSELLKKVLSLLGTYLNQERKVDGSPLVVNTLSWQRTAVVEVPQDRSIESAPQQHIPSLTQIDKKANTLALIQVPSCSVGGLNNYLIDIDSKNYASAVVQGDLIVLHNSHLRAVIDASGRLVSLQLAESSIEYLKKGCCGNQFILYDDVPLYWDAWDVMDYNLETRRPLDDVIRKAEITENGPLRVSVEVSYQISSKSVIMQTIQLDANCSYIRFHTKVDWHENRKFLKVEFPSSVHTMEATYEVQFGALQRPNHYNTSWDSAKFEVCGQKWADLSQYGMGLSVMTDSKYGYSAFGGVLRISLLRSPKAPDDTADMGSHEFCYAVMPHKGSWQEAGVVQAAFELNRPLHISDSVQVTSSLPRRFFWLDSQEVLLDTIKMSEDDSAKVLVLRLYEAYGGQVQTTLRTSLPVHSICRCNCLEEKLEGGDVPVIYKDGVVSIPIQLTAFQVVSYLLTI